jgi:hypothetical protein
MYVLYDDYFYLYLVGELYDLFVGEGERSEGADVEVGACFAAQVAEVVGFVFEHDLRVFPADGELVGVAEVVVGGPAELGAGEVEHLALVGLQVLLDPVVDGLVLNGGVIGGGL